MLKNKLLLCAIFTFCFASSIFGQTTQIASVIHTQYKINSPVLGEERTILGSGSIKGESWFIVAHC